MRWIVDELEILNEHVVGFFSAIETRETKEKLGDTIIVSLSLCYYSALLQLRHLLLKGQFHLYSGNGKINILF